MTCIETLPPTKSSKHNAITWTTTQPGQGELRIDQSRGHTSTTYRVCEIATVPEGFAFEIAKLDGDEIAEQYQVFCARNGQDQSCTCKGFFYGKPCKHLKAIKALISNEWLDGPRENPDMDCRSTECPF